MDFNAAIKAHSDWNIKLKLYLKNPDGSIDVEKLKKDNLCDLGCWLHGEGSLNHRGHPNFKELIEAHRDFHIAAADIVKRKNAGEDVGADVALGAQSKFGMLSAKVITLLMKMNRETK